MVYPCFIHGFVMVYQHLNRNMSITCDTRKWVWGCLGNPPEARCLVFDLPGCENQHFQQDAM